MLSKLNNFSTNEDQLIENRILNGSALWEMLWYLVWRKGIYITNYQHNRNTVEKGVKYTNKQCTVHRIDRLSRNILCTLVMMTFDLYHFHKIKISIYHFWKRPLL